MSDVVDRVKKIVVEHLSVEESSISDGSSFIDDLGADSLDTVELVMAFEEEFGIEIPDEEAENFNEVIKREFGVDDFNLAYIYLDSCDDLWDFYLQDERFETTEEQDYAFDLKNELWNIVHNPVFKDHEDFIRGYN